MTWSTSNIAHPEYIKAQEQANYYYSRLIHKLFDGHRPLCRCDAFSYPHARGVSSKCKQGPRFVGVITEDLLYMPNSKAYKAWKQSEYTRHE